MCTPLEAASCPGNGSIFRSLKTIQEEFCMTPRFQSVGLGTRPKHRAVAVALQTIQSLVRFQCGALIAHKVMLCLGD